MELSHASSDRRKAHRPRHQVDRPRRLDRRSSSSRAGSPPSSPTSRTTRRRPGSRRAPSRPRRSTSSTPFQDPNDIPTIVVYHRDGGLTAGRPRRDPGSQVADIQAHGRRQSATVHRARSRLRGRRGRPDARHLQLRQERLERPARHRRRAPRDRRDRRRRRSTSPAPAARRPTRPTAFAGIDGTLLFATLGVVILILLFTYRSPILWILPIFSAVVALMTSRRRHLLPRQVRRPHRQRPEPGHPHRAGDRRRHRLRPAAGGPISRGAPPPRGPARGDGVRAAPRRAGDLRERRAPSRSACSA